MNPRIEDGWLVVDCDAPDHMPVHLCIGKTPSNLVPAFRDYSNGVRVAKALIPVDAGKHLVHIKVGDVTRIAGALTV